MDERALQAIDLLESRLARCERSQRRWRRLASALGLAMVLLVSFGATASHVQANPV